MREVLFRGKKVDDGEWVEGHIAKCHKSGNLYIVAEIFEDDPRGNCFTLRRKECLVYEVIPETVGQFIGKTVSYNQKLFSGDKVKYTCGDKTFIGTVVYKEQMCVYVLELDDKDFFFLGDMPPTWLEVIGNIFDTEVTK